ncbi:MAG: DsbA family protein [Gammaproteobacteria bacterium]|nr:DsbA family protein [Gammaproteobacteria bacterium]
MKNTLYYVLDPMCSWCWGFSKTWSAIKSSLSDEISIQYVMGGLAPDSNEPMTDEMRDYIQTMWRKIERSVPGTKFNYDFWTNCSPRRSTYLACRAVIAIRKQNPSLEEQMINSIQHTYYIEAKNPSDDSTLIDLASKLDIDIEQFKKTLNNNETQSLLLEDISIAKQLGAQGFPSLFYKDSKEIRPLQIDYNNPRIILDQISY